MNGNTIEISKSEYKKTLELAYKASMLKEALMNSATLDFYGRELYFGGGNEVATICKYAFPSEYADKLRELMDEKTEDGNKEGAGDER